MKTKTETGSAISHPGGECGFWVEQPWSIEKVVFEIKHRLWMRKVETEMAWWELEDKIRRLLHCRWGFHSTTPCSITKTSWNEDNWKTETVKQTRYLECRVCHLLQFPTVEDRKAYLEIRKENSNLVPGSSKKRRKK